MELRCRCAIFVLSMLWDPVALSVPPVADLPWQCNAIRRMHCHQDIRGVIDLLRSQPFIPSTNYVLAEVNVPISQRRCTAGRLKVILRDIYITEKSLNMLLGILASGEQINRDTLSRGMSAHPDPFKQTRCQLHAWASFVLNIPEGRAMAETREMRSDWDRGIQSKLFVPGSEFLNRILDFQMSRVVPPADIGTIVDPPISILIQKRPRPAVSQDFRAAMVTRQVAARYDRKQVDDFHPPDVSPTSLTLRRVDTLYEGQKQLDKVRRPDVTPYVKPLIDAYMADAERYFARPSPHSTFRTDDELRMDDDFDSFESFFVTD